MPKYVLNGKTYNIPDSLTSKFESENPNATIGYTAGGKHYNIPVSKRDKFLKAFPDATTGEQKKGETQTQMANQQVQSSLQQRMYTNGEKPTKPIVAAQPQPTEKAAVAQQPTQPQPQQQKKQEPYKPSWQEQMAMGMTMGNAQHAADNATKGIDQIEQNAKKASPFGSGNVGLGNNGNLRKGKQTFDAEKGAFVDTYLTSDGREFRDIQQANGVQAELDNNADVIRYNNAMKSLGMGDISEEKDKPIGQRLKEAYAERMELQRQLSEIAKRETSTRKGPRFPSMVGGSAETYSMSDESKNLSSALRLLERRITALEAERDDEGQSMFWRGTADTLKDPSAYSLGLTDLADTGVMSQLKAKLDSVNGDVSQLSDTEKTLVRNYMMNQEAQRLNENRGNMYGFGQMFGQSLPFMAEFYLTGGFMGIGSAGTRLGTKAGLKVAGSELGKQMTKNLGGRVLLKTGQSLLKGTGRVGGALTGGALQSNTIGAAKTYSDIANRNMGNLTLDDKGNLDFKDGEGIAEAFLKGQLANAFENGSELLGPAFDFAPNYLARVIKNKVAGGAINKMLSNKAWRGTNNVLKKFGVQGLFGEGMEEEANNIGNVLIGESNWFKDPNDPNKPAFFDGEEQFKTWAGVALTGAILRGPALAVGGYQKAQYYANKYNLNSSESQMRSVLGDYDRYQNIKAMLEGATNENIGSVLNSIVRGGQLNNQEKGAVVMYAQDLVNLRGFNIGSVVAEAVGATPKPQVANYNIRGLHVDEVDKDGNVLASHDYENADDLKAGLYELQQQRFDDNLQSDISIMKTRPNGQYEQLTYDYWNNLDVPVTYEEFMEMLAKPSMERTEEEQQLVAPFADLLHNTVYDNTMLHEEQSQQDGQELADADSIDIEEPNEDGMNLNAQWMEAQGNRRMLFDQDENLRQEVELMESQGLSHQEIISRLDWARPEQVQGMIDYYNTKAKYEGYMNRIAQKIDEEAANSRERHTMKGTIDGVADLNNVHTITDGTNRYYLFSGDVTTDPATGQITGSTSGLIIGMDLDGSFVQIGDGDGYSVEPVTQTLDQFEEAERVRLQEQVTSVVDPNQTMNPAANATGTMADAGAVVDNAEGDAGASTGTGANEPLATAPAGSAEEQQVQIPVDEKTGVKLYEQGVPVDDAIKDMEADGLDVNAEADLAINEAQEELNKMGQPKTRAERVKNDARRKELQTTIDYYTGVKQRYAELHPTYADATPFVQQMASATSKKKADEILNAALQAGVNPQEIQPVHTQRVSDIITKEEEARRNAEEITDKDKRDVMEKGDTPEERAWLLDRKRVPNAEKRRKLAKLIYGDYFDDDFDAVRDVYELISSWLGKGRTLDPDSFGQELGWDMGVGKDAAKVSTMFSARRQNGGDGMLFNDFVHMVAENSGGRFDTEDVRNALIEMFQQAQEKSDLTEYQLQTRIAQAENTIQEELRQAEEAGEEVQDMDVQDGQLPFGPKPEGEERPAFLGEEDEQQTEEETKAEGKQEEVPQSESREQYLASHPLTEEQIMADSEALEDEKLAAIDFLKGEDDSAISQFYYDTIYNRARQQAVDQILDIAQKGKKNAEPQPASNPLETMERTAQEFRREQQKAQDQKDIDDALKEFNDFLDNAKGSGMIDKFIRKGVEGNDKLQSNLFDALTMTNAAQRAFLGDLLRLASKVGYAYIKSGIHDAQAWSRQMADTIGRKLQEVLGWEDSLINDFIGEVWEQKYTVNGERMKLREHAEKLKNGKGTDTTVNVNKKENNETENVVTSQQEEADGGENATEIQGDSAEFAERQGKIADLRTEIFGYLQEAIQTGDIYLKTMQSVKGLAKKYGLDDMSMTDLQELVEAEVVNLARRISNDKKLTDEQKFEKIRRLYEFQPTLSARDNDRINKQQYSTPAPMAYLMGQFVTAGKPMPTGARGLEPSAGNGMLTIALPKEQMHVNDIDEMRLDNLAKQGFGKVTSQDGTRHFDGQYDVIVTNPPFGTLATPVIYDGLYEIRGLEHQMTINALASMKDDGRAAIIVGGNTEYTNTGVIKGKDRVFLNYLYSHYNVVDVINMDGKALYTKQGTGYPVRMILINGRKKFDKNTYAPVQSKARAEQVKSYDELYKRVNDDILSNANKPAGVHDTASGESRGVDDTSHAGGTTQTGVRNIRPEGRERQPAERPANGRGVRGVSGNAQSEERGNTVGEGSGMVDGTTTVLHGSRPETSEPNGTTSEQAGEQRPESGRNDIERPVAGADNSQRVGQRGTESSQSVQQPEQQRGLSTEKVPYKKQSSNPFTLQSLMPAEQADEVKKILEELGDVDQFLMDELGYSSKEELHRALAAEQIDSVAMAIHQMNQGNAFIIGDQTGIGKGRQAAALIRYGVKKGGFPVFITVKKALFSDMYRDLCDIGSPKLRPFIWSADDAQHSGNVTDKDGNVIYQMPSPKEKKRVVEYINKHGKLPPEYDYVLTTYDSFKSGTMDYEGGKKSPRKFTKGKSAGAVHVNGQANRDALEVLAGNSFVIMDESHNAGGEGSNVSNYLQYITTKAKGITFLSATFAKRPGNMPIYSLKTAIAKAGVKVEELIDAVKRGGATFQEIMSKALTGAGQMIRRERDMTGVTIDWRGIEDEAVIEQQREQYDKIIGLFNDIIDFQRTYIDPIIDQLNDEAAEMQGEVDHTPGTRDMGINNTPFASRTYNMVQQVLLSLKAEEAAKRAIEHLKLGRKPVITVANTNEGAADAVAATDGESMEMPDLGVNLKKGLQGTLRIQTKDANNNATQSMIPFDRLPQEAQQRYAEIMTAIENSSSGLSLSPIDVIKNELKKAGYKVGELTGRQAEFVYNADGTVKRVRRQDTDKKKVAADFNNGKLDALILNRSAGTGISLHASTKFKDQRQRIMIVAQAQGDVNDEVQIRGRIDRTGQVLRGMYEYVVSQIPSEQRLLMMLKAKLRSLDANTTSSQKSKFNEMQVQDIMNKYGDQIVVQYLAENPEIYAKLADPLKWGDSVFVTPPEALVDSANRKQGDGATASMILGRMALLTVREQEKMLDELGILYQAEIDRLNEMGENDLEITEMPLKAKTLSKQVWEQGIEPGGKNPFADNTYVEKVNMDVLKKPMKASEVKAAQERLLDGKTWEEYKQSVMEKVDAWAEQKKADTTATITERAKKKAEAEQEKYVKGAKKAQEKNQMTDEEIERNGGYQYDTFYKQEMVKLNDALAAIEAQKQVFVDALETFNTDDVYALPSNIYDLQGMTFEPGIGKLIDIKITDNMSPNASTLSFATLDGRRKITIPINGKVKQQKGEKQQIFPTITSLTAQAKSGWFGQNIANTMKVLAQNLDNWDKLTSSAARKDGYIITGNLLKALVSTREQGVGGKLISYTTDTGEVRQGILMPDNFEPAGLTSKTPISAKKDELKYNRDKVTSADGDVTVQVTNDFDWNTRGYDTLELVVPKSSKRGAKYFNDETLLSLVWGQFEGSSKMKAEFPRRNLDAVMKRLDELGVTVNEEHKEDSGTKLHVPIDTVDPMEAIAAAAESWEQERAEGEGNKKGSDTLYNKKGNRNGERQRPNGNERRRNGGLEKTRWSDMLSRHTQSTLDRVGKQLGVRIKITNKESDSESDGRWSPDARTITLSVDTANDSHKAIMKVFGHELTHAIKQMSEEYPEVWDAFVAVVKEHIGENEFSRRFKLYREAYDKEYEKRKWEKLDDKEIEEEICADFAGDMLFTDEKFVKDLIDRVDREGGDVRSFIDKMLDFIKQIIDNIMSLIRETGGASTLVTVETAKEIWSDMYQYAAEKQMAEHSQEKLHVVTDQNLIDKLDKEPKITVYRAMQLQDGKLYPPMAAKVNGQWQDPLPLGKWSEADEHPELVDKNGKFTLDKGNGKKVEGVVYAPYMHGSTTMLNDQFKEAQSRPELVVVEAEMPESELTSGYQAEKSPRTTGRVPWKAGTIQGQLTGTRDVILSRWVKPVRIVPASEVAQNIKQMIDGQVEVMPTNVVTPEQREELAKLGVKFVKTDNKEIVQEGEHKGEQYSDAYGKKAKQSKKKARKQPKERLHVDVGVDPMEAINNAAEGFWDGRENNPEKYSAKAVYDDRLNRVETVFSEAYQDAMVSLKTAQNAIARDKDIPDSQNAYMAENLMHGKNKNEQDLYNTMFRDPLIGTINKIMNLTGMNWGDIDRYVYTKSGLERNREFFVRDWIEQQRKTQPQSYDDLHPVAQGIYDFMANRIETDFEDGTIATEEEKNKKLDEALQKAHQKWLDDIEREWQELKSSLYADLKNGDITFADYINGLTEYIQDNLDDGYEPSKHDYSGFRAMFGDEEGRYNEDAIIEELMDTEGMMEAPAADAEGTVAQLWEQINNATRYGLERYREAGMRSDEQIDKVEQMFHFYVPMRGFKEETGEDMYQYFTGKGRSKSYVGGLLKHAKGRGSEANYPISTIFAMSYKAISDCNQNLVNQRFYRFCQANPNDLVVLSDSWAVLNEHTGEWEESSPEIPEDASEDEVREIALTWEEEMRQLSNEGKAKKIRGKAEFDYKPIDKKNQSEHIVDVRINGQPKKMVVTGNPRMAQALNGQLRFEHGKNVFSKWNAAIKNFMASVFTSYSPTFALRNMFRDWTHFRTMLGVREGEGYAKQANKYYRQSLFKMIGLFKKYREGTLDESKEMERDFKDFMDNGGITGFVFMQKIDDIQKEMENIYKKQKAGKPIRLNNNLWEKVLGAVEALNEGIENNARFATYRASRHYAGRTKARSAYDAKEITVNFNRKGAGSKTAGFKSTNKMAEDAAKAFGVTSQILGEGRIFFNATVQAIATTFKNFQNPDGSLNKPYIAKWTAKYALPPFMFGLLLPAINKALAAALGGDGDDDPYANLPEWTRRRNLCFYIGNNNFITIPIGQELAAFLTLGDIFAGNTYAPELKPVDRDFTDEMVGVMNTFSPVDVSTKITKGGLMEDPISEVAGRTFSVLAPLVAVEQNLGWTGRPIYREDKFQNDQYTPEYQMIYQSTNPVLVNASKLLHELGGGDDITRGKLEVNPAIIQYLWEQYTGGPGKVFSNTISIGKDAKDILTGNESDFNVRKVEGLKAFVQQGDDRTAYYRTQAKYRKYKEDAEKLHDAVSGYEMGAAENPEYLLKLEQLTKGKDFVRMQIVKEADKNLNKINKAANQAEGKERKELRKQYNEAVKEVVKMLDEVGRE